MFGIALLLPCAAALGKVQIERSVLHANRRLVARAARHAQGADGQEDAHGKADARRDAHGEGMLPPHRNNRTSRKCRIHVGSFALTLTVSRATPEIPDVV